MQTHFLVAVIRLIGNLDNLHYSLFLGSLTIPTPQPAPRSSSIGTVTIGQIVADVPSGLSLTAPQEIKKKSRFKPSAFYNPYLG
jgi:hypothetical protein